MSASATPPSPSTSVVPLWEMSKENAAPIERGRNVDELEASLRASEADKQRRIDTYWQEIRRSEGNNGDGDALEPWLRLIRYVQSAYPSSNHVELLEDCVLHFHHQSRYHQDERFVKVCCLYASLAGDSDDPLHVFDRLHQLGIGSDLAVFWIAWAWQAERCHEFALARSLLESGLQDHRAQPAMLLQQRYQQFQRRERRRLEREQHELSAETAMAAAPMGLRGALGRLTVDEVHRNDRTAAQTSHLRTFTHRASRDNNSQNRPTLQIYREPEEREGDGATQSFAQYLAARRQQRGNADANPLLCDADGDADRRTTSFRFHRREERRKENLPKAEHWNQRGGLVSQDQRGTFAARPLPPPSFQVFVDPECASQHEKAEREQQLQMQQQQVWLREGLGGEDRRRRPSALSKGTKSSKTPAPMLWWDVPGGAFDSRLLVEPESGLEQSLEEARAQARFFTTLPATTSPRALEESIDPALTAESFDSSMSMADEDHHHHHSNIIDCVDNIHNTAHGRRLLDTITPCNASMDSSVNLSARCATATGVNGAPTPTINTQWALRELSVMFCSSPGVDEATPFPGRDHPQPHLLDANNDRSIETSKRSLEPYHDSYLHPASGCLAKRREPPHRSASNAASPAPNNHLLGPPSASQPELLQPTPKRGLFAIYRDEETDELSAMAPPPVDTGLALPRASTGKSVTGFSIYQDEEEASLHNENTSLEIGKSLASAVEVPKQVGASVVAKKPAFVIHADEGVESAKPSAQATAAAFHPENEDRDGDTASISLVHELIGRMPSTGRDAEADGDGDTASFSLYQEFLHHDGDKTVDDNSQDASSKWNDLREALPGQRDRTHSMSTDDELPAFGDLSCIAHDENETTSATLALERSKALRYVELHQADVQNAAQVLHRRSRNDTDVGESSADLYGILSEPGLVCHCPGIVLPRLLQLSSSAGLNGSDLRLGRSHTTIAGELGRGAYGVVALLSGPFENGAALAVKAQKPSGCLAWEYEILQRVNERLGGISMDGRATGNQQKAQGASHLPYIPVAFSYLSLADGALLGMTAGLTKPSLSLNLVDLVNIYKVRIGRSGVPEILALYYTARMLHTLEVLHWRGKVLHCDVKPDNWVLVASRDPKWEDIEASELMLVDFGRAVDLQSAASDGMAPMEVKLLGKATCEEMMCVAMRQGLPWSFDADTFGVCASAHVLLFGQYLELQRLPNSRWRPKQPLKRYFHQELWTRTFDKLLNLDDFTGTALDSRPASLRLLRQQIQEHLDAKSEQLHAALKQQALLLPSRRQDLHK